MKPFPATITLDLEELKAVEDALDALPYRSMDPKAEETRAQAIADHRKAKAEKEHSEARQKR